MYTEHNHRMYVGQFLSSGSHLLTCPQYPMLCYHQHSSAMRTQCLEPCSSKVLAFVGLVAQTRIRVLGAHDIQAQPRCPEWTVLPFKLLSKFLDERTACIYIFSSDVCAFS